MRKLVLVVSTFGFVAFTGLAQAEDVKTERSEKSESSTTLTGKRKTIKSKKVQNADGSSIEATTETVTPKPGDENSERSGTDSAETKTDSSTTLTGKRKKTRTTKVENADGSSTETKTETVAPKK